jgi:endonuclease YncB( thermonuclease family)
MKNLKLIGPILLALLLINSVFAQDRYYGTVTEVIDGKTVVIEPQPQVKIKLELQFIEVPESEQQLSDVVKNHLSKMILNKNVEFLPKNLNDETRPSGKVLLNGVDVGQQMLRDGAAWYAVLEKNNQNETESILYQNTETLARNEKRGVWSIAGLKPAWEFRAAKEEAKKQAELEEIRKEKERLAEIRADERAKAQARAEERRKAQAKANQYYGLNNSSQLGIADWQDPSVSGLNKKSGYQNLLTKYIPQYGIEYTLTNPGFDSYKAGQDQLKIEIRSLHVKKDNIPVDLKDAFGIGFLSASEKGAFAKSNNLTISADQETYQLGPAFRFFQEDGGLVKELLLYRITNEQLAAISKSKNVRVKIGNYAGGIGQDLPKFMKELIESAK